MSEPTLESLALRVAALEKAMGIPDGRPWRKALELFAGNEITRIIDEEGRKIREAEREEARKEPME